MYSLDKEVWETITIPREQSPRQRPLRSLPRGVAAEPLRPNLAAQATAHLAADIPGFLLSSSGAVVVVPSGVLVVELAGLEAAVEDADPPVAELTERGLVADLPVP